MNDGGPIFPNTINEGSLEFPKIRHYPGMTLRDWFAGQALAGWLASFGPDTCPLEPYEKLARFSYSVADAMIAERSKEHE